MPRSLIPDSPNVAARQWFLINLFTITRWLMDAHSLWYSATFLLFSCQCDKQAVINYRTCSCSLIPAQSVLKLHVLENILNISKMQIKKIFFRWQHMSLFIMFHGTGKYVIRCAIRQPEDVKFKAERAKAFAAGLLGHHVLCYSGGQLWWDEIMLSGLNDFSLEFSSS